MASTWRTSTGKTVLAILAAALLCAPLLGAAPRKQSPSAAPHQPMPALKGGAALDYLKQHGLYDSLEKAAATARYEVRDEGCTAEGESSFSAENPAQGINARFDGKRFTAQSGSAQGNPWELTMRPIGAGYGEKMLSASAGAISARGGRIEISRELSGANGVAPGRLLEWYNNRASGIEQGFTLASRPEGGNGNGPLRLVMEWEGDLSPKLTGGGSGIALESNGGRQTLLYNKLSVQDARGKELASRFEVEGRDVSIVVEDRGATYPVTIDPVLTQIAELTTFDGTAGDDFGSSVSISGDTAVVGAFKKTVGSNSNQGSAYVFERNSGGPDNWGQAAELTASDGATNDLFGFSVSIAGNAAVVGAYEKKVGSSSHQGAAYVFERNAGVWSQVKKLTASDGTSGDELGYSVSLDGDTAVVGAAGKSSFQGAAYIFERNSGGAENWGEVKKLTASDGAANDEFGSSVSIDGGTAVVGAFAKTVGSNFAQGAAYVFERNSGGAENWGEVKKLTASDGAANDHFAGAVSIKGDTAVAGALGNASRGAAYVFERNSGGGDNWGEVKKLIASDGTSGDRFGASVSIDGDKAVVGAFGKNSAQGVAYVFERNAGGAENWGQISELAASDGAANDWFGSSVSIDRDTAVVGAVFKTLGTNIQQGAAYVFAVGCDDFSQLAEPVASDGAAFDLFGYSVSISGDTAIVGAEEKGSIEGAVYIFERNSGGADIWGQVKILTASDRGEGQAFGTSVSIDGDTAVVGSTNNNSIQGAAYVFERNSGGADNWGQVKELTASDGAAGDRFGASVGISGGAVVVGAFGKSSFQGAAYVFERNFDPLNPGTPLADSWGQVQELIASDGAANDWFGYSVAISGDTAAVGAFEKSSFQGAAYVFERNFDPLNPGTPLAENWGQVQELTASDGSANDAFGFSVSVEADTAFVGAFGKSSHQGAAYVFERNAGGAENWGQVRELTASDGASGDEFGISVAIDGDIAVVAADGKSSHQGAAYMFERNTGGAENWGQVRELTASDGSAQDDFGNSVSIDGDTAVVGAIGKSHGRGSAYVFGCNLCTATTTTAANKSTQYSDPVDLSATVTSTGTVNTGTVKFSIVETGDVVGTANVVSGTATLTVANQTLSSTTGHYPDLSANTYTIKAEYSGENDIWCASSNTGTLTVSREDAVVTPSAGNACSVKVNSPGGTAGPVSLCADITEATDESYDGDISNAVPVTFTLIPVLGVGNLGPVTATTSGGGVGGTLHACATFSNIPVNVYTVVITVGGNYYTGTGYSVLAIYDPSLGFVSGGGTIRNPNNGRRGNFGFSVKYLKSGVTQGSMLYLEHQPNGGVSTLKASSLKSLSIVGNKAVILSKSAKLNNTPNYGFQITVVDNGEPPKTDQFGLKVTNPNGTANTTYTFPLQTLQGGNIQVPHK